jgi:hypothetical protein
MEKMLVGLGIALITVILAVAGVMMSPIKTCSVDWVDRDNQPIQGLYDSCPAGLKTRSLGGEDFTQVGNAIFRVHRVIQKTLGDGLRPHVSVLLVFEKMLDQPADLEKLEIFHNDDRFLSEGTKQFLRGHSISLKPPLDFAKLRPVPPITSMHSPGYLTDGTWVIFGDEVVRGADPATFHEVVVLRKDGLSLPRDGWEVLAVDAQAVYHGAQKVDGADPSTFGAIAYLFRNDAPPGVATVEPNGVIGFDHSQAWRVGLTQIERFGATEAQLRTLREDQKKARTAASIGW